MNENITSYTSVTKTALLFVLLTICLLQGLHAQVTGNEWIEFNQSYYKIQTTEDGIYRLTYDDLLGYGFPVNSVDPRRIQLFHKGQEQAILIAGQEDARIHPGDYIDFYGKRNDGSSDAELYVPASAQPHQYYSLFTDSTSYFLTWRLSNTAGKRMSSFTEANVNNLPAQPYHLDQKLSLQTQEYAVGRIYPEGSNEETILSQFDFGEGWTGTRIRKGQFGDFSLNNISRIFTLGPKPVIEILLTGRNNRPHNVTIQVGATVSSMRTLSEEKFNYYNTHLVRKEIEWSDISGTGDLLVRVLVIGFPEIDADFASVSFISLKYPQQIDLAGFTYKKVALPVNATGKTFVEFQNTPSTTNIYDITDNNNIRIIGSNVGSGSLRAIVSGTEVARTLFLSNGNVKTPLMKRVRFRNINPANHNYLIVSNKRLMRPSGSDPNPVRSYASYRASTAGGGYDTLVVEIQQLYDQFSYGEPLPTAIRKFVMHMMKGGTPEYLFLIGNSLHIGHNYYRQNLTTYAFHDLVPTMGYPGADTPFTAGLAGTTYEPGIPTGRLTAKNPDEVKAYLNKVIEMEGIPFNDLFRKNLIHLSGGVTAGELVLFKQILNGFKDKAEDNYLGGKVKTLSKSTNNSVELININEEVNKGVSLITFFGHSSPTIIDIEIGFASNDLMGYKNKGKYPIILVNGCNAGNIFSTTYTFGEDWIVTPDRGALGVIAHSSYGYVGPLNLYSDMFYSTAFQDSTYIHKPIGDIHKETARKYLSRASLAPISISQAQQMVLQGDPAVTLFGADKPDYAVQDNLLYLQPFEGMPITALADSFAVAVIVKNFGRTQKDSITLEVKRTYSDGRTFSYEPVLYKSVKYQDTLYYTVRSKDLSSFGNNRFEVILDGNKDVPELDENNNAASFNYFIPLSGITNLLPVDFSIVNKSNPVLQAQSTDILSKTREYIFELDTAYNFNSPYKKQGNVNADALASWQVNLIPGNATDSIVYYWRTKFAQPQPGEDDTWNTSSFVYIHEGTEGWAQA
nr:C25 family cysteine peptidase [Bacteroidota bacterium]